MKNNIILFRIISKDMIDEYNICKKYFNTKNLRTEIENDSLVICRYSALPFYKELEFDIKNLNSRLINSYDQHNYIANFNYYYDIIPYTFKTYFNPYELPENTEFIVKGKVNSKKNRWNTHMYAKDKATAINIGCELLHDSVIGAQDIIYREFDTNLKIIDYSIHNMPLPYEWRLFYYKDIHLSSAFYWINIDDEKITFDPYTIPKDGREFSDMIAKIISPNVTFFSIDIAQKNDGSWVVIEINDGQQSGLSFNSPDILYSNLKKCIE